MSAELVKANNLERTYKGDGSAHRALRNVSITVAPGEFVALMGPSGCGKSTLLNMLSGVDRPESGEVWVSGRRIDQLSETNLALFRRHHVGIVFQFFNLVSNLSVRSNIELPGQLAGVASHELRRRTEQLLEALDIAQLSGKMPTQLSGGQRQRVAIARALINKPALLLADEPTGALDLESGLSVMNLFARLHRDGQTIVVVTHDVKVAGYAQRILLMQDGQVVEESAPAPGRMAAMLLEQGAQER